MEEYDCHTRYPILLIHGTGFRDWKKIGYWGRIPDALAAHGAQIYFGGQDAWATVEQNGRALKQRIQEILSETGNEKVHLIAHSKGGLEARYLVSSLGMAPYVSSVTLIATPNRGSKTMDVIYRLPKCLLRSIGFFINVWFRLLGDKHPDFYSVCFQFTTAWAQEFNRQNPDVDGIFYRSYTGVMSSFRSDVFLWWLNLIIYWIEGDNDGLVTVESAAWTGFQGIWRSLGGRGVSHMDEVDFRRCPISYHGNTFDPVEEYIKIVSVLKNMAL